MAIKRKTKRNADLEKISLKNPRPLNMEFADTRLISTCNHDTCFLLLAKRIFSMHNVASRVDCICVQLQCRMPSIGPMYILPRRHTNIAACVQSSGRYTGGPQYFVAL